MKIRKLESRSNEFVEQFRQLLSNAFPPPLAFKTKYFLGEDKDSGKKGLYFELMFIGTGMLYSIFMQMKPHETVGDIEEQFVEKINADLTIAGIAYLNNEAVRNRHITDQTRSPNFKSVVPSRIMYLN
jgi:hypothetical protein